MKRMAPSPRSRTRGWRTLTGPIPVWMSLAAPGGRRLLQLFNRARDIPLNAAAFAYMHKRNLVGPVITRLAEAPGNGCKSRRFASEGAWMAHLEQLGITALNVHPEPVRIATEGALWGAIQAHGLLADTVNLSDDAGQFNVGRHALCWVHAERLIHKLDAFTDHQRREKERIQARLWSPTPL